jgi:hypothetical protein
MRIIGGLFAFAGLPAGAVPFPSRFDLFNIRKTHRQGSSTANAHRAEQRR